MTIESNKYAQYLKIDDVSIGLGLRSLMILLHQRYSSYIAYQVLLIKNQD